MIHLDEITWGLQVLELKEIEGIQGYDTEGIFTSHMVAIECSKFFPSLEHLAKGRREYDEGIDTL